MQRPYRISFFVSPHGLGHAARSCALVQSLRTLDPDLRLRIYAGTPEWFFRESMGVIDYRPLETDLGLVQRTPLEEDIPATLDRLRAFMPFEPALVERLARETEDQDLIVCDIAPLGVAVAAAAGMKSVLIENFTWSWIYSAYLEEYPQLAPFIEYSARLEEAADERIQTRPVCRPIDGVRTVEPMCRRLREPRESVRRRLGVPDDSPLVLVSMGGVAGQYPFLSRLRQQRDWCCAIPGAAEHLERDGSLITLPARSDFYHPDLVNASDALITKAGYSTLAEARQAGVPMGWFARERFPESTVIGKYLNEEMPSLAFALSEWDGGAWIERIPELLAMGRTRPPAANGANEAARMILEICAG